MRRGSAWRIASAAVAVSATGAAALPPDAGWAPTAALVARIERQVTLPQGAHAFGEYQRYYAAVTGAHARRVVEAVYLGGFTTWSGPQIVTPDLPVGAVVVDRTALPQLADGGCDVVTLYFDGVTGAEFAAACNGHA